MLVDFGLGFLIPWHWEVLLGHGHHLLAQQYKNCTENKVSHSLFLTAFKLKQLQLTPIPIQAQVPRHTWLKLEDKPGAQAFLAGTWYSAFAPSGMPCTRGSPTAWAQGCKAIIQCIRVLDTDTSSLPSSWSSTAMEGYSSAIVLNYNYHHSQSPDFSIRSLTASQHFTIQANTNGLAKSPLLHKQTPASKH